MIDKFVAEYKLEKYLKKQYFDGLIVLLLLFLGFLLNWGIKEMAFYGFTIWFILNPVKSEIMACLTILMLIVTPIALLLNSDSAANNFAIAAYYFLILTTIMAIYENYFKDRKQIKITK